MKKKIYLNIEQQIELLKSKNLLFKDEKKAKVILQDIGYYKLVNAYKIPFIEIKNNEHLFVDNTFFEEIYSLYEFDRKLKTIVFEATTSIEIKFKSLLSDTISKKYGTKEKKYLKKENFLPDTGIEGDYTFKNMRDHINKEIKKQYDNNQPSIKWYKDNYNYIPFWVVVNILTIGSVSRIYSKLKDIDKMEISKQYLLPYEYLASYIRHINLVRNICAHNDVLYRYKSINSLPQKVKRVKYIYESIGINKNDKTGRYIVGTNDFFATIIIFKQLLSKGDYNVFKTRFNALLNDLKSKIGDDNYSKILNEIGLPEKWKQIKCM